MQTLSVSFYNRVFQDKVVRAWIRLSVHWNWTGLVENWSSLSCPFCGEVTRPFGGQALSALGDKWGITERIHLPLDPALMALGDAGELEDYDNPAVMGPLLEGFCRALPGV